MVIVIVFDESTNAHDNGVNLKIIAVKGSQLFPNHIL